MSEKGPSVLHTKRRVLITGLTGFTGRHVGARFQAAGYDVFGLGSQPRYAGPLRDVGYVQADLNDEAALARAVAEARPHVVVHLAAIASIAHGDADSFYRTNLLGTRRLLAVLDAAKAPLSAVLLASSANIYGQTESEHLGETDEPRPANDYAISKLAMEHVARLFLPRLPLIVGRPFNYTGRGQSESFLVAKIIGHFRRREPVIELGNIDVARDFSDVRAVAEAYVRLAESAPVGEVFNICSGRTYTLRQIMDMAARASGHALDVRINPSFVRSNDIRVLGGDPAKLRAHLARAGQAWSVPPLEETIAWMLADAE